MVEKWMSYTAQVLTFQVNSWSYFPLLVQGITGQHLRINANCAVVVFNGVCEVVLWSHECAQQACLALLPHAQQEHPSLWHGGAVLLVQLPQVCQDRHPSFAQDLVWNLHVHVELGVPGVHVLQDRYTDRQTNRWILVRQILDTKKGGGGDQRFFCERSSNKDEITKKASHNKNNI